MQVKLRTCIELFECLLQHSAMLLSHFYAISSQIGERASNQGQKSPGKGFMGEDQSNFAVAITRQTGCLDALSGQRRSALEANC